jgi:hypothetical protein
MDAGHVQDRSLWSMGRVAKSDKTDPSTDVLQLNSHEAGKSDIGNVLGGIPELDAVLNNPTVPVFMEWSWLVTSQHI